MTARDKKARTPYTLLGVVLRALPPGRPICIRAPYQSLLTRLCNYHHGRGHFRTRRIRPNVWEVTRLV